MSKQKICVVTGTRADYGLLYWVLKEIQNRVGLELQVVVTGMHLSPEFGLTYKLIEEDEFTINGKVEMLLSSDTPVGIAKSTGLATIGFADTFDSLKPDLLVVLGDRYEILAAAQAALVAKIPIAHVAGGDTTEGAFDEAIRHSITKMSHIHFVTNSISAKRVRQLGENPNCIFEVGSPGIDYIKKMEFLSRAELEESLGIKMRKKNLLITFHPTTLDADSPEKQFTELLDALDRLGDDYGFIFTMPNSDTHGRNLMRMIEGYCSKRDNAWSFISLGQIRYLSAIKHVDVVVGNSSSGLYEVPSFQKPTVNIGDRQKGRLQAESIINCRPNKAEISLAIEKALTLNCSTVVNPYGDGKSSKRMVDILEEIKNYQVLLKKQFFEVDFNIE